LCVCLFVVVVFIMNGRLVYWPSLRGKEVQTGLWLCFPKLYRACVYNFSASSIVHIEACADM
jgi:hypothetical protein